MSLVVLGSVALDTIEIGGARHKEVLGGSGTYAALAASLFVRPVSLVGIVGDDFPRKHLEMLESRGVDMEAVQVKAGLESFRWHGRYFDDCDRRETVSVTSELLMEFDPELPARVRACEWVLLGNSAPQLQRRVLEQMESDAFVLLDTMDLWIRTERDALNDLLSRCDMLVLNEHEAEMLTGTKNVPRAARLLAGRGARHVVVKKGSHGVTALSDGRFHCLPAYPLERVEDPTGAGDSFAGALLGALAAAGGADERTLPAALARATAVASLCCEAVGADAFATTAADAIEERFEKLRRVTDF